MGTVMDANRQLTIGPKDPYAGAVVTYQCTVPAVTVTTYPP